MILNMLEPAMTVWTNINSLGIKSASEWEEDPSKDGSGSHRGY